MKLTPMDINNKEFKKALRGYNPEEVDEFLDNVVVNFEELFKENANLKDKITSLNEKVEHYSKIESTIQNTLVLAQNAAEQAKNSAKKEAEITLKNANDSAQRMIDKAHDDVITINDEYERVKQEFIKFRAKYRNFMNTQLETFDDLEKDFIKNYNVSEPVDESEEIEVKETENPVVKEEIEKTEKTAVPEKKEAEVLPKDKEEAANEEEISVTSDEISTLENLQNELNEIKSFFVKE